MLQISANFTHSDHSTLRHYIANFASGKLSHVEYLYENYLLFFNDEVVDQANFIKKYCHYLESEGYVKHDFYDSLIARTKISSTYIARGIALPHGSKESVMTSVISMINLRKPIKWDDEDTDFIILVAANDNDVAEYNFLFRKVMKIASSDKLSTALKACRKIEDLKQILKQL